MRQSRALLCRPWPLLSAVALLWLLGEQPLAAQQRSRATTKSPPVIVAVATCCEATEELWERYRNTAPAERPAELAFLGAQGFTGALRAVVKDTVMWARLWSGMHHGIMQPRTPSEPPPSDARDWVPYEPPLPVALARLRRLDLPVRFIERTRYVSC